MSLAQIKFTDFINGLNDKRLLLRGTTTAGKYYGYLIQVIETKEIFFIRQHDLHADLEVSYTNPGQNFIHTLKNIGKLPEKIDLYPTKVIIEMVPKETIEVLEVETNI